MLCVGRLGGEEFGILLPNTSLEEAFLLGKRLRENIGKTPALFVGKEIFVTASIGVTAFHPEINSIDELLRVADDSLYAAKGKGKNCVVKNSNLMRDNK